MRLKFSWQTWVLIIILLLVLLVQIHTYSQFEHLPSPIFGGDFYRDRGFVQNVVSGYAPWESLFYLDELQYYGYLWPTLLALAVLMTGWSVNAVYIFSVPFLTFAAGIIYYLFGRQIFEDDTWALLYAAIIIAGFNLFPEPKSTSVALLATIPLFLLFWLRYEKERRLKYQILAGFFLGITALVQGGKFLGGAGIFIVGIILLWMHHINRDKSKGLLRSVIGNTRHFIKKYLIFALVALAVCTIFFGPILLEYGTDRPNPVTTYGDTRLEFLGVSWILKSVTGNLFLGYRGIGAYVLGIAGLLGIFYCVLRWKKTVTGFILLWFIANIVTVGHHLVTKPFLDFSFLPEKLPLFMIFSGIFITFGLRYVYLHLRKTVGIKVFAGIILIVLLLPIAYASYQNYSSNRWVQYGMQWDPATEKMYEIRDYLMENLDKDDVVLANDETGFALAVLSARKQMLTRRTHASYFVDINQRIADAAVIMYGDDPEKAKELLEKYKVTHFYKDQHLVTYPMRTSLRFRDYLDRYGVKYEVRVSTWDPAMPPDRGFTEEMLIIPPQNITQEFNELLVSERKFIIGNQLFSELYRINLS